LKPAKVSEGDVNPAAVLEPNPALPAPVNAEVRNPLQWSFGAHEMDTDVTDRNKLKGGVGREKDVRGYPIWRFPMSFSIRGTNKGRAPLSGC
jgi:hypothetical protein